MAPAKKVTLKMLKLKEKVDVIRENEESQTSAGKLALKFNVDKTQIQNILK